MFSTPDFVSFLRRLDICAYGNIRKTTLVGLSGPLILNYFCLMTWDLHTPDTKGIRQMTWECVSSQMCFLNPMSPECSIYKHIIETASFSHKQDRAQLFQFAHSDLRALVPRVEPEHASIAEALLLDMVSQALLSSPSFALRNRFATATATCEGRKLQAEVPLSELESLDSFGITRKLDLVCACQTAHPRTGLVPKNHLLALMCTQRLVCHSDNSPR